MRSRPLSLGLLLAACGSSAAPIVVPDAASVTGADAATVVVADAAVADAALADAGVADAAAVPAPVDAASDAGWPAIGDYGARGPFTVTRDKDTGPAKAYDVFRPAMLGRRHPIISWANGTKFDLETYAKLLEHWASHGFVVIAAHTNTTAGGATHKAGIDWLVAEATRTGSPYAGALDTKMIGASGHSQGGGATIAAGSDAPGPTGLVATAPLMALLHFEKDASVAARQKVPMLDIIADQDANDTNAEAATRIFSDATGTLVQASFHGIHEDAWNPALYAPTLAWFRYQLMADEAARAFFYPAATCKLCSDPLWAGVRYKP